MSKKLRLNEGLNEVNSIKIIKFLNLVENGCYNRKVYCHKSTIEVTE
jgi:hypothetical protein